MFFQWLKRKLPYGLYGRAALILILPVVTLQLVVSIVFLQRHFEGATRQMTVSMAYDLSYIVALTETAEDVPTALAAIAAAAEPLRLAVLLPVDVEAGTRRDFWDFSGRVVVRELRARVKGLTLVDLDDAREVRLILATRHGPMQLVFPRSRVAVSNPHQLLVLMLATGLLMTFVAYVFLRNQLRPITRLAKAAEAFGMGRVLPYSPRGATEVRAAGAAFLDMRARIEQQIEQRTLMFSGISHDLRTPLTRLRLGLSMLPPGPEAAAMERDVREMGGLVDSFLDFAQAEATDTAPEARDPAAFLAEVVADARRAGQEVTLTGVDGEGLATFRPDALRRALENLLANADRHAARAEVSAQLTDETLCIIVEDDGPGIPAARRGEALRPFTRLDPARNQNAGQGVGLGLAIAADIARGHGGELHLGESARLGGLRAELVLAR
ncbi:MAG: ATP-binding protein [Phaeovulum sp.]|uniref:ATP-binding protein n=1 Tax=Phaeovulum sp. TaxID=2934796 RepID=UPI0027358A32|nr:ATP-binding protein [Phaeovulum sp.]MDP3862935.1 ATP-binding protein [Phaeovulum sp.]